MHDTYGALENIIDGFMAPSRRNNMFCQSCLTARYGTTRYCKLNASMLERSHTTVEFRQHSGTIEAGKILPWIRFTRAMMNAQGRVNLRNATSLEQLCTMLALSDSDRAYFAARTARFARQAVAA